MTIVARHWVPSAAVVPQERGSAFLGVVDSAEWSEGCGFYRGFFTAFRIKAGKDVWFHFPLQTPVESNGNQLFLESLSLLWECLDGARISWIVAQHGGMERLPLTERMGAISSRPVPFDPPELWRNFYPTACRQLSELTLQPRLPLMYGVQLCVMVSASDADATVRFYGAGAAFSDQS